MAAHSDSGHDDMVVFSRNHESAAEYGMFNATHHGIERGRGISARHRTFTGKKKTPS
jgi:hypothetical protein